MDIPDHFFETDLNYCSLSKEYDISKFSCSESELTDFLKEDALDNQLRNFSVTHLAYWNHNLVGYFTLVNDCISVDNLNPEDRYDDIIYRRYPALKIARIATDTNYEKKGIGSLMIDEIFYIAFEVSKRAGCRLLTVDAKKNAVGFYINCGFKQSNSSHKDTSSMYMEFHNALHQR